MRLPFCNNIVNRLGIYFPLEFVNLNELPSISAILNPFSSNGLSIRHMELHPPSVPRRDNNLLPFHHNRLSKYPIGSLNVELLLHIRFCRFSFGSYSSQTSSSLPPDSSSPSLPPNNGIYGVIYGGPSKVVADGRYVITEPFPKENHTVYYKSSLICPDPD